MLRKLAELARIAIPKNELHDLQKDMEVILKYVSHIQKVATDAGETISVHTKPPLREDENPHESGIYTQEILKGVPKTKDGYVEVKKIISV